MSNYLIAPMFKIINLAHQNSLGSKVVFEFWIRHSLLREAHSEFDLATERLYRSRPFESDEERLAYLFEQYEKMI